MTGKQMLKALESMTDEELDLRCVSELAGRTIDSIEIVKEQKEPCGFIAPYINLDGKFIGGERQ
jgi:hypothetical protein